METAPKISFVNESQFLVVNQASIDELNEKLKEKQFEDPQVKLVTYVNFRYALVCGLSRSPINPNVIFQTKFGNQYTRGVQRR